MADLSLTMQAGLEYIRSSGGAIERRQGGYWVKPSEGEFRAGIEYVAPRTVYALETRGMVTIVWQGRTARASLTQAGINATNAAYGPAGAGGVSPSAHQESGKAT